MFGYGSLVMVMILLSVTHYLLEANRSRLEEAFRGILEGSLWCVKRGAIFS